MKRDKRSPGSKSTFPIRSGFGPGEYDMSDCYMSYRVVYYGTEQDNHPDCVRNPLVTGQG
jgi:hypothetical protein